MMSANLKHDRERFDSAIPIIQKWKMTSTMHANTFVDNMLFNAIKANNPYWCQNPEYTPVIAFDQPNMTLFVYLSQSRHDTNYEFVLADDGHTQSIDSKNFKIFGNCNVCT